MLFEFMLNESVWVILVGVTLLFALVFALVTLFLIGIDTSESGNKTIGGIWAVCTVLIVILWISTAIRTSYAAYTKIPYFEPDNKYEPAGELVGMEYVSHYKHSYNVDLKYRRNGYTYTLESDLTSFDAMPKIGDKVYYRYSLGDSYIRKSICIVVDGYYDCDYSFKTTSYYRSRDEFIKLKERLFSEAKDIRGNYRKEQ